MYFDKIIRPLLYLILDPQDILSFKEYFKSLIFIEFCNLKVNTAPYYSLHLHVQSLININLCAQGVLKKKSIDGTHGTVDKGVG